MLTFAVLTILSLFSGHALAVSAPNCNSTSWKWTYNSIGQSPCLVAAWLIACLDRNPGNLGPVGPGGSYPGPTYQQVTDHSDGCQCNTVVYSLLSACGACQGGTWLSWSDYFSPGCDAAGTYTYYREPIPNGTSVPYWALIDVTVKGTWDPNLSRTVGDTPEAGPDTNIDSSGSTAILPVASAHSSSSGSRGSSPNVGALVGGVVGGAIAISIAAFIIFLRRQRKRRQGPPTVAVLDLIPQQLEDKIRPQSSDGGTFVPPSSPASEMRAPSLAMKLYDPNDPTTFPWDQGTDPMPKADTEASSIGHTLSSMPSPPPVYRGLPIV